MQMKQLFILIGLLVCSIAAVAQHEHHGQQPPKKAAPAKKPAVKKAAPAKVTPTKKPATAKKTQATQPKKTAAPQPVVVPQHDHSRHTAPAAKPDTSMQQKAYNYEDHIMHEDTPMHEEHNMESMDDMEGMEHDSMEHD